MVPSLKGMKGAPSPQTTALPALAAACRGAAALRKLDNSTRMLAASATKLYEAGASSWTDRTRASGGDYGLASDGRFRFAQFGDVSLAAAKSDILQSSSSGAFANVGATAPKLGIVVTVGQFVIGFDIDDQGTLDDGEDYPDGWWAAAKGSHSDWTPSIANECAKGRLTSTPGRIRAGRRFGAMVVAYKDQAMYLGQYVGPPNIWVFDLIPGETGALSQEVVVDVGTPENPKHIFMGFEDFYSYDGSRPVPIGGPLKETVFGELNKSYAYASMALHDRVNSRIYFYYPVGSAVTPDKCVVYNYKTGKWGRDDRTVEMVVEFITAGIAYDDLGSSYSTYDDLPALSYDSSFWVAGYPAPAIFNTSHVLQTLNGTSTTGTITTGDYGSDDTVVQLSRVQPSFLTRPSSATMTNYYRMALGDSLSTDATTSMDSKGRFDVIRSANWHRVLLSFTGNVEIPALRFELQEDGSE